MGSHPEHNSMGEIQPETTLLNGRNLAEIFLPPLNRPVEGFPAVAPDKEPTVCRSVLLKNMRCNISAV